MFLLGKPALLINTTYSFQFDYECQIYKKPKCPHFLYQKKDYYKLKNWLAVVTCYLRVGEDGGSYKAGIIFVLLLQSSHTLVVASCQTKSTNFRDSILFISQMLIVFSNAIPQNRDIFKISFLSLGKFCGEIQGILTR